MGCSANEMGSKKMIASVWIGASSKTGPGFEAGSKLLNPAQFG
jgi:hypothetical protein